MRDLAEEFMDGSEGKGSYLSRVFGIFNEKIIQIWAQDDRSPYQVLEKRPTLYDASKHYTLDFLFVRDGLKFVSEMKCEIQYQKYEYWKLTNPSQLDHHANKNAFRLFLKLAKDSGSVLVKTDNKIKVDGTILVWGSATNAGIEVVKSHYGFSEIITLENCINDLIAWNNKAYLQLLNEREQWISSLFSVLRGEKNA